MLPVRKQRHFFLGESVRLPSGYSCLREDLGARFCAARKERRLKQSALATDVGICRETLSRIESGRQVPRPRVLHALMGVLELDWDAIAEQGPSQCSPLIFLEGRRGDFLIELGQRLQQRRQVAGLSLRALTTLLGISAAQLSRLERGQAPVTRLYRDHPADRGLPRKDRRVLIEHRELRNFMME